MRLLCVRLGLFAIVLLGVAPAGRSHTVTFENGRWFDGERFVEARMAVADGHFSADIPDTADEVVDLEGRWVIPPLADAHTHVMSDTPDPAGELLELARAGILFLKNPNSTASGVRRGREAAAASVFPFRATFSGSGVTSPGGHPSQIYRAHGAHDGWHAISSPQELSALWKELEAVHPDFVKVYLEDSELHATTRDNLDFEGRRGLDPELLAPLVRGARARGWPVVAHVRSAADFRRAVDASVDEINHLPLERFRSSDALAAADAGIRVVTTIRSHRPTYGAGDLEGVHRDNLAILREAGVDIALGTDNGAIDVVDELFAVSELEVFEPAELLRVATTSSIRACLEGAASNDSLAELASQLGELRAGQEATFLVLEGDPLQDLAALRRIHSVWIQGHQVSFPKASTEKRSLADALGNVIHGEGIEAGLRRYHEWYENERDRYDFSESQLNDLGYALLSFQRPEGAVRFLRLNVERFPHSVNAWDSLAEAQEKAGDWEGVARSSRQVLALLPNARDLSQTFRKQLEESALRRISLSKTK